jgi:hypothetical protein
VWETSLHACITAMAVGARRSLDKAQASADSVCASRAPDFNWILSLQAELSWLKLS